MNRHEALDPIRTYQDAYHQLITQKNRPRPREGGLFERYVHPVLTSRHTPPIWRYDFNPESNRYQLERLGINAVFNSGAVKSGDTFVLMLSLIHI